MVFSGEPHGKPVLPRVDCEGPLKRMLRASCLIEIIPKGCFGCKNVAAFWEEL